MVESVSILTIQRCSSIKDWAYSAVTKVTNILLATSVPLPLPPDRDTILDFTLPDFLSHCKKADKTILDSPLESVLLRQNLAGSASLTVDFEHNGAGYTINISAASPKYDIWHYLSFLTTSHRLERDTVELSCRKEEGAWANAEDPTGSSVKIRFKPKAEVTFATVIDLLRKAESRYWFHFWNNAREWTWPWWFIRSIANPLNKEAIASVQLDGGSEAHSLEGASFLLSRNKEEWRSAISHDYGRSHRHAI